ncbi:hypothetical protein RMATCC62417_13920 [Rhizopus microsporus]|nr:hypothetical protein RMATCC62417_13920 [Rhizopus microsporus]
MLRFGWILNTLNLNLSNDMTSFIVAALEVYRRFQWNFFRLENEHINNCGNFRAIKEIPLPFAFAKTNKVTIDQEEGRIQLPIESHEVATPSQAKTSIDMMGSFYGRRDFENKQDLEEKNATTAKMLNPRPSKVEAVLERIKSRKSSVALEESETDQDDSLEDEDSD